MSVAEAHVQPIFGPITIQEMQGNEELARHVMKVVADAAKHSKGRYNAGTVANGLLSGRFKLWGVLTPAPALEAAIVTQQVEDALEIIIAGPEFRDAAAFLPRLKSYAKSQGCKSIRLVGRMFFQRLLPKDWFVREVVFESRIDAG